MLKRLKFCVISCLTLLAACGGGSDNSSNIDNGSGGTNPPPPPPPALTIQANALDVFGALAINLPESMLQITHYSDALVNPAKTLQTERFELCDNGGARTITVSQLPLAVGSVITDKLEDCQVNSLNAVVRGEVTLTVTQLNQNANTEEMTLDVNFSQASFMDAVRLTLPDIMVVNFNHTPLQKQIQLSAKNNQLRFQFSDGDLITALQFQLNSELNLGTALYRNQFQSRVTFKGLSGELTLKTAEPLQGFMGEYPHQGKVELSDNQNNVLTITANQVVQSEQANLRLNNLDPTTYHWNTFSEGAFWLWPGISQDAYIRPFRHDNFALVGVVGTPDFANFATNGTLSLLFSRPVASVDPGYLVGFFNSNGWNTNSVDAEVSIEGALIHLKPKSSLKPGANYWLGSFELTNNLGIKLYNYQSFQVTVTDVLEAIITKDRIAYSEESKPQLSASSSVNKKGSALSYQWEELSNFGVVFDDPQAETTGFRVTNNSNDDLIKIRLTITDANGATHSTTTEVYFQQPNSSIIYFESDSGDYIGAGQTRFLTTTNGVIDARSGDKSAVYVNFEGQSAQYSIWWSLSMATASDKTLQPGLYQNATRTPFKPNAGNGLEFTGESRGCNTLSGSFEIFEISFVDATDQYGQPYQQVTRLAADFIQHCEGGIPALRGKVRVNSDYTL